MPQTQADAPPQPEQQSPMITAEEAAKWLPEALQRPPIFDLLKATPAGRRQLQLIRTRSARNADDGEVAQFLELCAQYMLDWNAGEAWCAVSNPDDPNKRRVLLMVGRDGLRKIAQRNGLDFDGDVVREHDAFKVTRSADRTRTIEHAYGEARAEDAAHRQGQQTGDEVARGKIVGAWCEVYERATGNQRGYFYAPIKEYMPTSEMKLRYSPWGSQVSVMILAAAERTALSQATPLGGLVAVGELDAGEERAEAAGELTAGTGDGDGTVDVELPEAVREVIARARELGHDGLSSEETASVAIGGQSPTVVSEWIQRGHAELDKMEPVLDAEAVVDGAPTDEELDAEAGDAISEAAITDREEQAADTPTAPRTPEEEEHRTALRDRANGLLNEAEALRHEGNDRQAEEAEEEAENIIRDLGPEPNPAQDALDL